ncbi:MAG TPA: response regulator [Abditibacteriaceae bacterium]|nr:response regulator [Abditibacteriaceae bacterium]
MTTPTAQPEKPRILVIEDDASIGKVVIIHAATVGLEGHYAEDGLRGLAAFKELNPHVVVLDLMMPGMDGREVCAKIRESSTVPIVILTAKDGDDAQLECFGLGADEYITKPFEARDLMVRVLAQLRRVYRYDQAEPESGAGPEPKGETHLTVTLPPDWGACRDCGYLGRRIRFESAGQSDDGPVVCPNCGKNDNIVFGL